MAFYCYLRRTFIVFYYCIYWSHSFQYFMAFKLLVFNVSVNDLYIGDDDPLEANKR